MCVALPSACPELLLSPLPPFVLLPLLLLRCCCCCSPLVVQVSLSVNQPAPDSTVTISSSITLRPSAAAVDNDTATAAAGVGEFGGAHWFAQQEQEQGSAAAADATAATATTAIASPEGHIQISSVITVTPGGVITLSWDIDTSAALPAPLAPGLKPSLPRVGLHALLPAADSSGGCHTFGGGGGVESVTWQGLGPHECYPDRKASGRSGQHRM